MKNHEWVDGKLLQTNKKYSHLKLKQKEKIYQWLYEAYRDAVHRLGHYPESKDTDNILLPVLDRIEKAEIWIPDHEVYKHYRSIESNLKKRLKREQMQTLVSVQTIEALDPVFSVCKVEDYAGVNVDQPFCFTGRTDEEKSLVCPVDQVPENTISREDGWRALRICGELDFSLIGVLARISKILANQQIGIFAISTFNTDYILVKTESFEKALSVLKNAGYKIKGKDETELTESIETEGNT